MYQNVLFLRNREMKALVLNKHDRAAGKWMSAMVAGAWLIHTFLG